MPKFSRESGFLPLRSSFTVPPHPDKHAQAGSKTSSQAAVLNSSQAGTWPDLEVQPDVPVAALLMTQAEQSNQASPGAKSAYWQQSAAEQAQVPWPQQPAWNNNDDMCGPMELTWEGVLQAATGSTQAPDQNGPCIKTLQH